MDSIHDYDNAPWNKSGIFVGNEIMDTETAIMKAGLNWNVEPQPIYVSPDGIHSQQVTTHQAVVRTQDQKVLGIVGNQYNPIQNTEAFDFMDSLVEAGKMRYHSAGSFRGGKRVWLLGKIDDSEVVPNDKLDHFLFLYNTHDGSSSLRILFTTIRIACANITPLILRQGRGQGLTVRHTKNLKEKIAQANEVLGIASDGFQEFNTLTKMLANKRLSANQWDKILKAAIPIPKGDNISKRLKTNRERIRSEISELYYNGTGQDIPGVAGTGWAAYNAFSEYTSHYKKARGSSAHERRFEGAVLGSGAQLANKAMNLILMTN